MKCRNNSKYSQSVKQPSILEYIHKPSENGLIKEGSIPSEHPQDKEESSSQTNQKKKKKSEQSIVECQVKSKKTTCKDKSCTCKASSQIIKCSKTSDQASTSKEKAFSPFWSNVSKEWSQKLWSPAGIDSVDLRSNCLNGCLKEKELNLPFWSKVTNLQKLNCQMMSCPSFKFSAVGGMEKEGTVVRVLKKKLRVETQQKATLRKWEAGYRFTYNKALEVKNQNPKLSKRDLRTLVVTRCQNSKTLKKQISKFGEENENPLFRENPWLLDVPKDIRQQAAFELAKNWKQTKGKNLSFKDKIAQGGQWVFSIEREHVSFYKKGHIELYSGNMKQTMKVVGKLPNWLIPHAEETKVNPPSQIMIQKQGKSYYMILPYEVKTIPRNLEFEGHIVTLDPGCRKFQVWFGTDGRCGYFGSKGFVNKLLRIIWYKEYLKSRLFCPKDSILRVTGQERQSLKKKFRKLQERLENIRRDFHNKVANWLTNNYECITIGKLPKGIISRDRSLPKIVKKAYNSLGHFKFRCCLKEKCIAKGVIYQESNESYTSKTCTLCGKLNDVGSSETYKCECSKESWDRDLNGARNILLKTLSDSYVRIVLKKDNTLSLKMPSWTQHPVGFSLGLNLLKD